jgi:cold shock CspA family protein
MSDTTNDMSSLVTDNTQEYNAQVKWYNPRENYGFAKIEGTDCDVFIHKKSIVGNCVEEERFWNKCLFEGEHISLTLKKDNNDGRVTGENIKSSQMDGDGNRKPLLFASPNMKSYVNRFRERWNKNQEWKTV